MAGSGSTSFGDSDHRKQKRLDELNDLYSDACDRIRHSTLLSIMFGGRSAITQLAQDVMTRHVFEGINTSRLRQWLDECQRLEGLRELSLLVLEKKAQDGIWPTSIDELKSSVAFGSIVHPSKRELFSYEVNATHVVIQVEGESVQFRR